MENYRKLMEVLRQGHPCALLSRYAESGWPPRRLVLEAPEKSLDLAAQLGLPNMEAIALEAAWEMAFSKGEPRRIALAESDFLLLEPFLPPARLIVLGGGHVALPLVQFAARVGFYVVVCDDRLSFAARERFPEAGEVLCDLFENCIRRLGVNSNDYVVIITRGHRHDADCLRAVLRGELPRYLGMIGSRRRGELVRGMLLEEGVLPERLAGLHSPIGIPLGAVTPEEIAVSILAELVQSKRLGSGGSKATGRWDCDTSTLDWLTLRDRPRAALVTVLSTRGSTPRRAGAKMAVTETLGTVGSIGGGCAEAEVIREAFALIGRGRSALRTVDLTDSAEDEGMVCGGIMETLIEDAG